MNKEMLSWSQYEIHFEMYFRLVNYVHAERNGINLNIVMLSAVNTDLICSFSPEIAYQFNK